MIEDSIFSRNQKKKEEGRSAPDFFGTLGKGILAKEEIGTPGNSPGLTPLGFGVDIRNRILNTGHEHEGLSTIEFTESTEILKNSSGLTPLRPFGRKYKKEVLE